MSVVPVASRGTRRFSSKVLASALALLALLYFGLRYERDIGRFCTVCASEQEIRQRGFALSESHHLWDGAISEEVTESEVMKRFMGTGHVHSWQTWSDLYIAVNGRSGGHPFVRWNPAARAWRYNDKFQATVRSFSAAAPGNGSVVRAMFQLPADGDGRDLPGPDEERTVETAKRLFEESGEKVPEAWQRLLDRQPR